MEGTSFIDLNDVWQPPARYDLDEVRERLAATARRMAASVVSASASVARPQIAALC